MTNGSDKLKANFTSLLVDSSIETKASKFSEEVNWYPSEKISLRYLHDQ